MGMISMGMISMGMISSGLIKSGPRTALCVAGLAAALLTSGCKEIQDIREEMGWVEPPAAPPPPPAPPSFEAHWVPADTAVEGASQVQWSMRWWQWVARFPRDQLPYTDIDGRQCAEHQEGPVWFLAGTDGSQFGVARNCKIPAGKHLFVPVINRLQGATGLQGISLGCAQMKAAAAEVPEHVISSLVLLDGRPLGEQAKMRIATECFDSGRGLAASDGFWLMIKPLPPGKHSLAIAAGYRNGPKQTMQNFRYELEVEGAPGSETDEAAEVTDETTPPLATQ